MISTGEARDMAAEWRPRFIDEGAFEVSWKRFFEMVGDPTWQRLEQWLRKDQEKDAVVHAGIVKAPLLPTQSQYTLSDCEVCCGKRYVRRDLPIDHPEFGKAIRCPVCNR